MSKHTPGPWHVLPRNHLVVESPSGNVAVCSLARASEADARLIAAAPDLLMLAHQYAAECFNCEGSGLITISDYDGIGGDADDQPCPDCVDIRAVIAKAEQP